MKKAMLFVIALMFSAASNAATLDVTGTGSIFNNLSESVDIVLVNTSGPESWSVVASEDTKVMVSFTFIPDTGALVALASAFTGAVSLDGGATSTATFMTTLLGGVVYSLDVTSVARLTSGTISSVPVPAAAWLLAPALIGLVGMRRKTVA